MEATKLIEAPKHNNKRITKNYIQGTQLKTTKIVNYKPQFLHS